MSVLDDANAAIRRTQDESTASAAAGRRRSASAIGTVVDVLVIALAGDRLQDGEVHHPAARETVGVLRNIAEGEGDLTRRVNQSTGDELGEMGRWFNTFIVKLEVLVRGGEEHAGGGRIVGEPVLGQPSDGRRRGRNLGPGQRGRGGRRTGDAQSADGRRGDRGDERRASARSRRTPARRPGSRRWRSSGRRSPTSRWTTSGKRARKSAKWSR